MHTGTSSFVLETLEFDAARGWSGPFPALDGDRTLVVAFCAPELIDRPGALAELGAAFPTSRVLGCSTAGEISGSALRDGGISVAVARFAHTRIAQVSAPVRSPADSFAAGELIARGLEGPGLKAVLVCSDGLKVNGSELVRGLNSVLPPSVTVTGGLAADGDRFKRTWVIRDGLACEGFVSAVGLYGDRVRVGHGSKGGWDTFGPERRVTRSTGNILYELDGQAALPLYKQYLGDRAEGLPATALLFPLALRKDTADGNSLVRTVLGVSEADRSLTFAGDIPQGWRARLMRANFDRLIGGAADSAQMTLGQGGSGPTLSVAISCVGRRLVLGQRTEEELESALSVLPAGTRQVGFYSYGEISPCVSAPAPCDLHNQTMTLTTISED